MKSPYITLQPSEQTLVSAAATIYAGYIIAERIPEGQEKTWMERALKEAIRIAQMTDATVQADKELD